MCLPTVHQFVYVYCLYVVLFLSQSLLWCLCSSVFSVQSQCDSLVLQELMKTNQLIRSLTRDMQSTIRRVTALEDDVSSSSIIVFLELQGLLEQRLFHLPLG